MSRYALLAFAATILVFLGISPVAAEPLIRAVIVDGHAYVSPILNARSGEPNWEEPGGHFTLLGQQLNLPKVLRVKLKLTDVVEAQTNMSILHRWQVDKERVHFLSFDLWAHSDFLRGTSIVSYPLELVKNLKTPAESIRESTDRQQEFDRTRTWVDSPVFMKMIAWSFTQKNKEFVVFDFLAIAEDRYEWYVSVPETAHNRITRLDSSRNKKVDPIEWAEAGVWIADFGSHFFVVSNGNDRYFINDEGNVYFASREAKPGKAGTPLKELWTDWKTEPVNALIHDVDNAKWYAFTKDQYFEVKNPIKPLAHTLDIARADTATETLETAAKCGRVIRGLPEPKGK